MASTTTDQLEVLCWVVGQNPDNIFPVQTKKSKTVANLRDEIKAKKGPQFLHIIADTLTLRKISISSPEQLEGIRADDGIKLGPLDPLSKVFSEPPANGCFHVVVVQTPPVRE